jgi:hypothetical protein
MVIIEIYGTKEQITSRNIKLKYKIHDKFIGKLFGIDKKLKKNYT